MRPLTAAPPCADTGHACGASCRPPRRASATCSNAITQYLSTQKTGAGSSGLSLAALGVMCVAVVVGAWTVLILSGGCVPFDEKGAG